MTFPRMWLALRLLLPIFMRWDEGGSSRLISRVKWEIHFNSQLKVRKIQRQGQ
jgi:hypothetical protein